MITKNKIIKIIELAKKCNECALHLFKEFDIKLVSVVGSRNNSDTSEIIDFQVLIIDYVLLLDMTRLVICVILQKF